MTESCDVALSPSAVSRRTPRARAKLLLLGGSLLLSVLLGEIAARILLPAPLPWLYPQVRFRSDPATTFALRPSQQAFSADKPVTINSRGLRGEVVPYERTPGVERLLFLGDSIVFGHGVADDEVVSERVAARLREAGISTEAVNAGVPAYNTEQEITYLEREGVHYHPDWVIVGVCWNDIADKSAVEVTPDGWLVSPGMATKKLPFMESPSGYAIRNALKQSRLLYGSLEGWRAAMGMIGSSDALTQFRSDVLEGRETSPVSDGWARLAVALHRLRALSDPQGFRPLLVAFPIPVAVGQPFSGSSYPARLRAVGEAEGIPVIDLLPAFQSVYKGHESLFVPFDSDHPNAAGHDLAAREIAGVLSAGARRNGSDVR